MYFLSGIHFWTLDDVWKLRYKIGPSEQMQDHSKPSLNDLGAWTRATQIHSIISTIIRLSGVDVIFWSRAHGSTWERGGRDGSARVLVRKFLLTNKMTNVHISCNTPFYH